MPSNDKNRQWVIPAVVAVLFVVVLFFDSLFEKPKFLWIFQTVYMQAIGWFATVAGLGYAIKQIADANASINAVRQSSVQLTGEFHRRSFAEGEVLLNLAITACSKAAYEASSGLLIFVRARFEAIKIGDVGAKLRYSSQLDDKIAEIDKGIAQLQKCVEASDPQVRNEAAQVALRILNTIPRGLNNLIVAVDAVVKRETR